MPAHYQHDKFTLYLGDCVDVMRAMPDASVDAIVTDPPYELGFMGKHWDVTGIAYSVEMWREALRVLKPGGHMLAFGGTRTYHRMACAIEDAGFEVRDCLAWMYGSGFPKSLDVSKAIDKAAGAEREVIGEKAVTRILDADDVREHNYSVGTVGRGGLIPITAPATDSAREWDGWGTALKPAYEPIMLARKPLVGTVAANVLEHGTGALNIDGTRIDMGDEYDSTKMQRQQNSSGTIDGAFGASSLIGRTIATYKPGGRWPANVLLDEEAATILDAQAEDAGINYGDRGGPSRFFYTAKASRSEREAGLEDMEPSRRVDSDSRDDEAPGSNNPRLRTTARRNDHPTVKPIALMRWLCRLITPPGGVILDPFNGSGTTGMAALDEGFRYIGIEREEHYLDISKRRIAHRHALEESPSITHQDEQGKLL